MSAAGDNAATLEDHQQALQAPLNSELEQIDDGVGFGTQVNCQCKNEKMANYRLKKNLPTNKGINHVVRMANNQVSTFAVQEALVSFHVEIKNAIIARLTTIQVCTAKQEGEIEECYSCFEGG